MTTPTEEQKSEYLKYIGFEGPMDNSFETLKKLVECHIFTFPFETINLHDRELDELPDRCTGTHFNPIFRRAVQEKRGGHCVALNILLQTMLMAFGFNVNPILPDVLWQSKEPKATRSKHCAAIVTIGEDKFLVDAAFGSIGLLSALPLKPGEYQQYSEKFKLVCSKDYEFECQVWDEDEWVSIFGFTQLPASINDYKEINNIESNPLHPKSTFKNLFLCCIPVKIDPTHNRRLRVCNSTFITMENDIEVSRTMIRSQDKLQELLREHFKIDLHGHFIRYQKSEQDKYLLTPPKPDADPELEVSEALLKPAFEPSLDSLFEFEPQPMPVVNLYPLSHRTKTVEGEEPHHPMPDVATADQRKKAALHC